MTDTRKKNRNWNISTNPDGTTPSSDIQLALLMDLRDELQRLNALLNCTNFTEIPGTLLGIKRNTTKPKRKKNTRKP
jgi:hypothetical protein